MKGVPVLNLECTKVLGAISYTFSSRSDSSLKAKRAPVYLLFTLFLFSTIMCCPCFSEEPTPETLTLTVYVDGFVFVDYALHVDPTSPTQNITVFGQTLEELLVVDGDGLPLDYSINDSLLSVDSLGANKIGVTYLTQDLTSKDGKYWTLTIDAPISTQIITAEETSIISLNKVPEMIQTNDNKVTLIMDAGAIEVTYVIGVIGTQEHAQIVLQDAEQTIDAIKNIGINVTEAETKLQDAQQAFNQGNYPDAETKGTEAKTLAIQINQTATFAQQKIAEAEEAIAQAESDERTVGLDEAKTLLAQAKSAYDTGNYVVALSLAEQAGDEAADAETVTKDPDNLLLYGILAAAITLAVIFVYLFVRSRNKPEEAGVKKKSRQVDVERIFRVHTDLMPEERQAIQFLAENNGEVFEADLYEYVKLPRTTTWRLVKRLQGMGIIKITKFRRQNLVRIKAKYILKKSAS